MKKSLKKSKDCTPDHEIVRLGVTIRVTAEIWSKLPWPYWPYSLCRHTSSEGSRSSSTRNFAHHPNSKTQLNSDAFKNSENQKPKAMTCQTLDAICLLSQANEELNQRRRKFLKPNLTEKYHQISSEHVPCTDHLFGDDPQKTLQEITATNGAASV